MTNARVLIADDHGVIRQGLKEILLRSGNWEVVGEACDGLELVNLAERHLPDIVIVDLYMPRLNGLEAIVRLQQLSKQPNILVLSAKEDAQSVGEVMRAGAKGFIPKSADANELEFALQSIAKGQKYLSPAICGGVLAQGDAQTSPLSQLSSREREVMKLLCEGHPNRQVAQLLHISPRTIDSHRANIMKKLGLNSNAELVQCAVKYGLIE